MDVRAWEDTRVLQICRRHDESAIAALFNFSAAAAAVQAALPAGRWTVVIDSADARWAGPGRAAPEPLESRAGTAALTLSPWSFVLLSAGEGVGPRPS
jgi:hypothetical protein